MALAAPRSFVPPNATGDARRKLVERLRSCRQGDRLPPLRDLARELNIGLGSVNRAVQELAREGVLVSRPKLGTFVADVSIQTTIATSSRVVGRTVVVNASNSDGMLVAMREALVEELSRHGVMVETLQLPAGGQFHEPRIFGKDAVVILNPNSYPDIVIEPDQQLLVLQTAAEAPVKPGTRYDEVTVDQEQGGALAGQYLREAGCRSACFLGVRRQDDMVVYSRTSQVRLEAFEHGWGARLPAEHCLRRRSYGESWGARMVADYIALPQRPEAVFAASDELAVGFVKGALAMGLEPGHDYQIIGFDGQQRGRELHEGPLTTIDAPAALMGRRGAEFLLDRLANPDQPTRRLQLGCTLFKGNTVQITS